MKTISISNPGGDTDLDRNIYSSGKSEKMVFGFLTSSSSPTEAKTHTRSSSGIPPLSRNPSFSESSTYHEDWEAFFNMDRLSTFDLLDSFALPQQLEKFQRNLSVQTEKVKRQKDILKSRGSYAKERVVEEWKRRVPSTDEQLDRYLRLMRESVDRLGSHWNDTRAITFREKISFICGVLNVLISGYLIGAYPHVFHCWYTLQLFYFMPIRFYTYQKQGYHYFLADLCYFVNFMCMMAIWVFPNSKRLFISTYCLAFGNNAVAIAMWRNSLVFHSFDKVTSLFVHIMPCVSLHCLVHLLPNDLQQQRFNAVWTIKNSPPGSPENYSLLDMTLWSTIPYAIWQLFYYIMITIRRRDKIAAGRPTSFTWLRKSYSKVWIGKIVLSLPESLQEPAFMGIQYIYALFTMLPCPIWFWYRYASTIFLMAVFCWSVYNGATYYIDVFGKRFQNELDAMKREVQKWENIPKNSPLARALTDSAMDPDPRTQESSIEKSDGDIKKASDIQLISEDCLSTAIDEGAKASARKRKFVDLPE